MENYILFDKTIENLNSAPFDATKKLFDLLNISYDIASATNKDIGFEQRFLDLDKYYEIFKPTLLEAQENKKSIIALENSSYLGLFEAKNALHVNVEILMPWDIIFEKMTNNQTNTIVNYFENFSAGIYNGSCEISGQNSISKLLKLVKAKEISLQNSYEDDAYNILELDEKMALQRAGDILYDAFDSGCDFMIVSDIRSFNIFDSYQKKIEVVKKRPLGESGFPLLSISQVLLMALGKIDTSENQVNKHTIKPSFI